MLSRQRLRYLDGMGIQAWRLRADEGRTSQQVSAPAAAATGKIAEESEVAVSGWDDLRRHVAECTACELHRNRTQTVFGTGDRGARWLVIGEAPGAEEDRLGEPFVGRAGVLLNAMLRAAGASREQVYIANIVKCRPPSNRNPRADEAAHCAPYLRRQIELLGPTLILAMGRVAASNLLATDRTVGALRGDVHAYGPEKIPLIVTYHPAYLLRKPSEKAKAWADLRLAMQVAPALAD